MILRNYFYLCIDRLDWIPNLKKNFSFFLLHLRIIGNFFKFFSILNPRTKQLWELFLVNVISEANVYHQMIVLSSNSFIYRKKGEYSHHDDVCSKIIPIIFAFRKAIYDTTSSFHLLLLLTVSLGKKIPHKGNERKGWKERRGRAKITIRDKVSSL